MEKETAAPVMDVATPKPAPPEAKSADKPAHPSDAKSESKDKPKAKVDSKVQQPAKNNNSVTAAIVATVFIVFGLAALATYAYFKQNV